MSDRAPIEHATLGRLVYDGRLRWYEGTVRGLPVAVHDASLDDALALAARVVANLDAVRQAAEDRAVADLLPLKNEAWLDEGEPSVPEAEFRRRLQFESVTAFADGAELYFADGDLFWGHTVVVRMAADGRMTDADIGG